jgi:uncharacterized protein
VVSAARAEEVEAVLRRVTGWAARRPDVRALALVGSWAYGRPREDSDVDLVLLTTAPSAYVDDDGWLPELDAVRLVRTATWGPVTERRVALPSGLEVELGIATPAWASVEPLDDGTRRVVTDGLRALHDPDGLLAAVSSACS